METEKNWENENPKFRKKLKLEVDVNELSDFSTQIYSINNILHLLYRLLEEETADIAEPSSAIVVCMCQLEHIYKRFDEMLGTALEYSSAR